MTLKQIIKIFPNENSCIDLLEKIKWNNQPICPYCNASNYTPEKNTRRYHCNTCNSTFSVTVKTIFHRTRCDLRKWFFAIYLLHSPPFLTARDLGEKIDTTKDTAWLITSKIRKGKIESPELLESIYQTIKSKI